MLYAVIFHITAYSQPLFRFLYTYKLHDERITRMAVIRVIKNTEVLF
jgi:hypothetical protein